MLLHKKKISYSVSSLSIDSNSTINEDGTDISMPNPENLTECNVELVKYRSQKETETRDLSILSQNVMELRKQKEPLMKIKDVLQTEIAHSNEIINKKSEEVTQLKNKLRHHSEKQIQNNIEKLEYQLRINNYKPKEEQKILDEICMLKRSSKTLKEYNLKELENRKYRSERNRLIEQRNEIYSNIHLVYGKEENEKREVKKMRRKITETTKIIDHLLNSQSRFEHEKIEEKRLKDDIIKKKIEEKVRIKKDQYLKKQEDRRKLWEEYESSREPYEEEKARCKLLISYMEKLQLPSDRLASLNGDVAGPKVTLSRSQTAPARTTCEARLNSLKSDSLTQKLDGTFYSKQTEKDLTTTRRMSKKEKAKVKKDLRMSKSKVLSHPPQVLIDLLKLKLPIPKTSDTVPSVIDSLKTVLKSYFQQETIQSNVVSTPNTSQATSCSNGDLTQTFPTVENYTDKNTCDDLSPKTDYSQMNGNNSIVLVKETEVIKTSSFSDSSTNSVSPTTVKVTVSNIK